MKLILSHCLLILLLCLSDFSVKASDEIVNLYANDSPPYWNKLLPFNGMAGEIVHEMSKEIKIESVISLEPLKRLIEDDSNNDLGNPVFYMNNQDFKDIVPIAVYYVSVFYHKSRFKNPLFMKKLSDLKGYRVGVLKGTITNKSMFKNSDIQLEESYSHDSLFKKLKYGRLDLCVTIDLVGLQTINRLYPDHADEFEEIKLAGSASPIAIMVADNDTNPPKLGNRYKKGLEKIIHSGRYNDILETYYGKGKIPSDWYMQLKRFQRLYNFTMSGEMD